MADNNPQPPPGPSTAAAASGPASKSGKQQQKQPQQPKAPAPAPKPAKGDAEGGAKSAKDLKREKRAAAVAARGGGVNPKEAAAAAAAAAAAGGSGGGVDGNGNANAGPSHVHGHGHGGPDRPSAARHGSHHPSSSISTLPPGAITSSSTSAPRRPALFASDASYALAQPTQSLFFSHLPIRAPAPTASATRGAKIHPLVVRLGVLMASGELRGANARTHAMMLAFRTVVREYQSPENADLWKDLPGHLSPMIAWLEGCRPKGVGGGNAIRWLKGEINRLGEEEEERTEQEQKDYLCESISAYIRDRITLADEIIAEQAREKIKPGDVVVTYARSSVVEKTLIEAWHDMRARDPKASFEVIVVDSKPLNEGRTLLSALSAHSIPSTYTLLPALAPCLARATLVLLGASALFANGALLARAGTALVAMLAQEYRVPVVVAVETYKFGEATRLDGLGTNEVAMGWREDEVARETAGKGDKDKGSGAGVEGNSNLNSNLQSLALSYDLTPAEYITALCTEIGFIPPSSVPTVTGKTNGMV